MLPSNQWYVPYILIVTKNELHVLMTVSALSQHDETIPLSNHQFFLFRSSLYVSLFRYRMVNESYPSTDYGSEYTPTIIYVYVHGFSHVRTKYRIKIGDGL
jgi:hypothetical protein